jgi:hypothetical protein
LYRYAAAIWNDPEVKKVYTVAGGGCWAWYWKRTRRCPVPACNTVIEMPRVYHSFADPAAANKDTAPMCAICLEVGRRGNNLFFFRFFLLHDAVMG